KPPESISTPTAIPATETPAVASATPPVTTTATIATVDQSASSAATANITNSTISETPSTASTTVSTLAPDEAAFEAAFAGVPELRPDNIYTFGFSEADRSRLIAQSHLFSQFLEMNARRLVPIEVTRFLDAGCGAGQLTTVLSNVYHESTGIGVDKD